MTDRPRAAWLLDWHTDTPYGLTALGVPADRLSEAEEKAASALAGQPLPASWQGADPALRRRLVAACRPVPTTRLWHVSDDRPVTDEARARQDCLRILATEQPEAVPLPTDQVNRLPGLTALLRLTALACRMPPEVWLGADEDLLDVFDSYTVGGIPDDFL
ncbi:hypothetical protein [Streptomyces paludis]|uniref:hypothetical protein n=1 Tax=Streptomyces paludis TaxID=2282738 RepID=UPI001E39D78A|nr:hypothetical protein [Streptomyces paludis]